MSKQLRSRVVKKLTAEIEAATDPKVIANLGNVLAKFLPKTKQTRRPRNTPTQPEPKEVSLNELVAAMEKKRREARKSSAGESQEVA